MALNSFRAFLSIFSLLFTIVAAEDPTDSSPGMSHSATFILLGILINGQFPGPDIYSVTNDNLIINVYNSLTEPFLLSCQATIDD
ncbi:hypothetical protein CK203_005628 [Vitis vinifera]|uniref:Plastocyanin-like domain-containing protein n=1 Tax=Vitis vinifera TaxID=29760 RepID=A0A438K456_VITVI|nr:hypothetical protein CK203_005628 [Vitis vinifera]